MELDMQVLYNFKSNVTGVKNNNNLGLATLNIESVCNLVINKTPI